MTSEKKCENCGRGNNRPAIFKGLPYCCVNCQKALGLRD